MPCTPLEPCLLQPLGPTMATHDPTRTRSPFPMCFACGRDRDGERERGRESRERDVDRRDHRDYERERGRGERDRDDDRDDRRRGDRHDDRRRRSRSRDRDYRRRSRSRSRGRYDYRLRMGAGCRGDGGTVGAMYYYGRAASAVRILTRRLWLEQQLKSRQMVLQQQAVSAAAASAKTQRELYIGNLVPGAVTDVALRQLFNATLLAAFPPTQPGEADPVANVNLHSEGRYAFVEFRSPEMATAALALNNQVQLLGQTISPEADAEGAGAAGSGAGAGAGGDVSPYLEVDGMLSEDLLVEDEEYESVIEDLRDECDRHTPGGVLAVKAYVSFRDPLAAQRAHAAIHGRLFAGSTVRAAHITAEQFAAVPEN
eukprot:XP_001699367.1 predicted protein [Chlamydomonas reinhardtii]